MSPNDVPDTPPPPRSRSLRPTASAHSSRPSHSILSPHILNASTRSSSPDPYGQLGGPRRLAEEGSNVRPLSSLHTVKTLSRSFYGRGRDMRSKAALTEIDVPQDNQALSRSSRRSSPKIAGGSNTSIALRRATTDPYPKPVASTTQGLRRGGRPSPYRDGYNKSRREQTVGIEWHPVRLTIRGQSPNSPAMTHFASFPGIPSDHTRTTPFPATPPQELLPLGTPHHRIPSSDTSNYAPFDPRSGNYDSAVPLEYDEFEFQEPFLDIPIPFDSALPKGFNPLDPLTYPGAAC
ncbi:unnamed protein product [Peniophora sp. CBMAI 1063]|nr:unnamed protein product [Peniophora sp. CBMAI 1063]